MMNPMPLPVCFLLLSLLFLVPAEGRGQVVKNVPRAFSQINTVPQVFSLKNATDVPTEKGHLQGVQLAEVKGVEKLLISGSSKHTAYVLQADLLTETTEMLIPLMKDPFRHAGGIQISYPYVVVGIEDNKRKTISKVVMYRLDKESLEPTVTIQREGAPKRYTAGATGLIPMDDEYLVVVGNWDSRNWDFYLVDPIQGEWKEGGSFEAPADWASYQSINLIKDENGIYAIGLYGKEGQGRADLILISKAGMFKPIMSKVSTREFKCIGGVDFNTAAGIQVDRLGSLHLWATQRDAKQQIAVNKYSPYRRE
ncbi:MAG: hypothetical protein KTR30_24095 [Saprospiraceae bacterium]|nr:hypothetical protein [Saprospiraceae bacterium]